MEGVVTLSLIANVFQVADFSYQLLNAAWQTYKSGFISDNATLEQIALDLKDANESLHSRLTSSAGQAATKDDQAIIELATRSTAVAEKLLSHTSKVSPTHIRGQAFRSICNGVKAVWKRDEISETLKQLQDLRDGVEYRIIISIRFAIDDQAHVLAALDTRTSAILKAIIDSRIAYQDEMRQQTAILTQRLNLGDDAAQRRHEETLAAIRSLSINPLNPVLALCQPSVPPARGFDQTQVKAALLAWLRFPQMEARRDAIRPAHRNTFEWVYSDMSSSDKVATGFPEWARGKDGIFWIKGKAGSGKSTLMKFIAEDARTHHMLSEWAGDKTLIFSSFYFWNQGNEMQKSAVGLLRSLLSDVLKHRPDLVTTIFPDWQPTFAETAPVFEEVASALIRLLKLGDSLQKICFFVDGLDEFEGDSIEMSELGRLILEIVQAPGVKVLVSSRPLLPFEESFRAWPTLILQDITAGDIHLMVTERLRSHPRMVQLEKEGPAECEKLIKEITGKSSGVFLWVTLAVRTLLDGLRNHDDIEEMFRRLSEIPPELEQLFAFILRRIPRRYASQAYRFLRIMHRWYTNKYDTDGEMTAVMLSVAENVEKHPAKALPARPLTGAEMQELVEDLDARIKSRCLGLLEIVDCQFVEYYLVESGLKRLLFVPVVRFLHRSVLDYLDTTTHWQEVFCAQLPNSAVDCAILEGLLANLKTACSPGPFQSIFERLELEQYSYLRDYLEATMHFNRLAEGSSGRAQTDILESIDATMSIICGSPKGAKFESPNWSTFFDRFEDGKCTNWQTTFLAFAIACGAELYVKEQLSLCNGKLPAKKGRPLLDYAVHPVPRLSTLFYGMNPNIARMLLESGADPNEKFGRNTVWSNVLYHLYGGFYVRGRRSLPEDFQVSTPKYHFEVLRTIKILLQHGADPNATFTVTSAYDKDPTKARYEDIPVQAVLRGLVNEKCPCVREARSISNCQCDVSAKLRATVQDLVKMLPEQHPKLRIGIDSDCDNEYGLSLSTENLAPRSSTALQTSRRKRIGQWFAQALRREPPSK